MFFHYNYKIVKRNEDLSQKKINNHITKQNVPKPKTEPNKNIQTDFTRSPQRKKTKMDQTKT